MKFEPIIKWTGTKRSQSEEIINLIPMKTDERKFNQDFQELLKYSKTLNDKLHFLHVPESNRSLLISGSLIALTDKAFSNSYKFQNPKEDIINLLIQFKKISKILDLDHYLKTLF